MAARKAAVGFVFVTIVLDTLALGIVVPVLPILVRDFLAGDTARAAWTYGAIAASWAFLQFLASPLLGALSDRFGRRPVLLLSNLGLGLDYLLMALAPTLGWLVVARLLSGVTASSMSTAGAYIADVTPPERRAAAFGMIGAAFSIGFVLGPALGGLAGGIDPRLPFWIAAGLSLANALYGVVILPESLPPDRRAAFALARANPLGSIALLRPDRVARQLAVVHFLSQLAHQALSGIFVLYGAHRYGWTPVQTGLALAFVGVCTAIAQGALVRPAVARLGERRVLLAGLLCGAVSLLIFGLAPGTFGFALGIPLLGLWSMANAALSSLLSHRIDAGSQGRLQGALLSLTRLSGLVGPALFAGIFGLSADTALIGLAWLLAAAVLAIAALTAARATRR